MHIIIDGYNVLKQVLHNTQVSPMQRRAFINVLGKYSAKKNHRITVVFDGGPELRPTQEKDHGITIYYSGIKESADDVITALMQHKSHSLLVITNDNGIKKNAIHSGVSTMDTLEFYALIKNELSTKQEKKTFDYLIKSSQEENALLDNLMAQNLGTCNKSDDDELQSRRSQSYKAPKKERAYLQKIKKL